MKLTPILNTQLGQWRLCHNQLCKKGETSIVAFVAISGDDAADGAWAKLICDRFNAAADAEDKSVQHVG